MRLEDQPLLQAVHDQAAKPIRKREGDTVLEVPTREAVTRALMAAVKGNARSQGLALDLIRSADIQRARDRSERQAFANDLTPLQAKRLERASETGEETRLIPPHPDDIVIDDDYGCHFAGSVDEGELRKVEQTVRYRDALIMQDVLDERQAARQARQTEQPDRSEQSGALLFVIAPDRTLPPLSPFWVLRSSPETCHSFGSPLTAERGREETIPFQVPSSRSGHTVVRC